MRLIQANSGRDLAQLQKNKIPSLFHKKGIYTFSSKKYVCALVNHILNS